MNNRSIISILPLTFVTIVEKGSFTQAADELGMAKSAVSQNLKRLENQLGVKLANRSTRRFNLTPAGERYYSRCKELLALAKVAATEMGDFGAVPAGPICITAPHAMIAPIITPAISQIISQYPGLKPTIIADDQRLDLIAKGIDIAITVGQLQDSNLKARKIGILKDVLCVSSSLLNHTQLNSPAMTISAIQDLPYIAHTREPPSIEHHLTQPNSSETVHIRFTPTLFCNTVEALLALVREGLGVAMLPEFAIAHDLAEGNLIKILPEHTLLEKPIYAVHAYDNLPPQSVIEVIRAIQEAFK